MEKVKHLVIFEGNPKPYLKKALEEAGCDVNCLLLFGPSMGDYWLNSAFLCDKTNYVCDLYEKVQDLRDKKWNQIIDYVDQLLDVKNQQPTNELTEKWWEIACSIKIVYVGRILPIRRILPQIEFGPFAGFELKKMFGLPLNGLVFITTPNLVSEVNRYTDSSMWLDAKGNELDIKVIETIEEKDAVLSEMADKLRADGYEVIFVTKDDPLKGSSNEDFARRKGIYDLCLDDECDDFDGMPTGTKVFCNHYIWDRYSVTNVGNLGICSRAPYTERECSLAELKIYHGFNLGRK